MSPLPTTTDVLIVGAGPTGLTLACALAQNGVPCVVVDRLAVGSNTSRAAAVHARTMEVLDELGVADRLHAQGHAVPSFVIRDRDHVVARIAFDRLPTRFPYVLMVPQNVTEAVLAERLRALGGDIVRPCAVTAVSQTGAGVEVTLAADGQTPHTIQARYVVGADGMHSTVREQAGIGFSGAAYEESFILADVRLTGGLSRDEVMGFLSPAGMVIVAPLPGGRFRIVATVAAAPEHPSLADVQAVLDTRGPERERARVTEIVWSGRFRVHHRLADRYRAGRIFLAGDAAHVHSPAGGQGMNTGIQDAIALAAELTRMARDGAAANPDIYEQVRRPVAQRVVAFTDRMTRMATLKGPRRRQLRNLALGLASRVPTMPRRLATELSGLRNR
jgi:2-polyprenyl-6-methoxyphenol hydroxylase-like FAD-dependent oxidoreductase